MNTFRNSEKGEDVHSQISPISIPLTAHPCSEHIWHCSQERYVSLTGIYVPPWVLQPKMAYWMQFLCVISCFPAGAHPAGRCVIQRGWTRQTTIGTPFRRGNLNSSWICRWRRTSRARRTKRTSRARRRTRPEKKKKRTTPSALSLSSTVTHPNHPFNSHLKDRNQERQQKQQEKLSNDPKDQTTGGRMISWSILLHRQAT